MATEANYKLFECLELAFEVVPKDHKFSEGWEPLTDVILIVDDFRFHVHKAFLSAHSPVFQRMFCSSYKEASSAEIPLPGKKPLPIYQMLAFFYSGVPGDVKEKDPPDVVGLLALAREYQVMHLTQHCEGNLVERCQSSVPTVDALLLSQEYGLSNLLSVCIGKITGVNKITYLEDHPRFSELSDKTKITLYKEHINKLERKCKLPIKAAGQWY